MAVLVRVSTVSLALVLWRFDRLSSRNQPLAILQTVIGQAKTASPMFQIAFPIEFRLSIRVQYLDKPFQSYRAEKSKQDLHHKAMKQMHTIRFENAYNRHTRIGCCNTLLPLFHQGKTLPCPIEPFFLLQCSLIFFVQVSVQRNLTHLSARTGADIFPCVLTFYPLLKNYVVTEARTDNSTYPQKGLWCFVGLIFG